MSWNRLTPLAGLGVGVCLIGFLDYITGPSISMTLFYLVPVAAAGWTLGRAQAVTVALLAGLVSLVDLSYGPSGAVTVSWNVVSRTCVLVIAAAAVERIRRDRDRLLLQDAQRMRSLQLLDLGLADPARQLQELADHWDGSMAELRALVRRRADEMLYLARDFSTVVRLQGGSLPLRSETFDFVTLIDEMRAEQTQRTILIAAPAVPLLVKADRERTRQVLSALIAERPATEELSFKVDRHDGYAELVLGSNEYRPTPVRPGTTDDALSLAVELAEMFFRAQGGSIALARNPLTRTLRISARLPLAE